MYRTLTSGAFVFKIRSMSTKCSDLQIVNWERIVWPHKVKEDREITRTRDFRELSQLSPLFFTHCSCNRSGCFNMAYLHCMGISHIWWNQAIDSSYYQRVPNLAIGEDGDLAESKVTKIRVIITCLISQRYLRIPPWEKSSDQRVGIIAGRYHFARECPNLSHMTGLT